MRIAVLLIVLLFCLTGTAHGQSKEKALLTPEQCRADIAFAFATMEDVHPNLYAWTPKATIARERAILEKSLTAPLSQKEFWQRFAPLVARLRDGHTWLPIPTTVWGTYRDSGATLFPLDVRISEGKMFVRTNYGEASGPAPGAEVLSINGVRVKTLIDRLMPYANEELLPSRWNQLANTLRALLYLNFSMTAPFTVEYAPPEGKRARVTLPGVPWQTILTAREATAKQGGGQTYYRYRFLPEDRIGLIEYDLCIDLPKFEAFLKETFTQLQKDRPIALIIDVRKNPGGIGGLNQALCEYITDKPYQIFGNGDLKVSGSVKRLLGKDAYIERLGEEAWNAPNGTLLHGTNDPITPEPNPLRYSGPIYCLIGPGTFSNGMAFASAIKDCKLGVLVGEETGGVGSAYGDFITFPLPNSGLNLNISLKHIFRPSGVDDGKGILPDFEVKQTTKDSSAKRDTVLEYTKTLIRRKSRASP